MPEQGTISRQQEISMPEKIIRFRLGESLEQMFSNKKWNFPVKLNCEFYEALEFGNLGYARKS